MNKKMREACLAVAEIFEALPECWCVGYFGIDEHGVDLDSGNHPSAMQWCAVGGLQAALNTDDCCGIEDGLDPYAIKLGYNYAAEANNVGGRLVAIKMLRLAGGEE